VLGIIFGGMSLYFLLRNIFYFAKSFLGGYDPGLGGLILLFYCFLFGVILVGCFLIINFCYHKIYRS
jgi:hypothetical protein